jgi:hypothetical protein
MFEMSPDTRLLRQHLRAAIVGQTMTYDELSKVIGKPVDSANTSLRSAINSVLRHDHIVFAAIRKVGIERLSDDRIVSASDQDIDGIRRKAKRGAIKLTSISDYDKLTPAKQLMHTARLSVLTMVAYSTSDGGLKKIEKAAVGKKTELPLKETLAAFGMAPNDQK